MLVHGVGADLGSLCPRAVGHSWVRPLAPYTFQVQPSVIVAEQTLQHRPVDRLEAVYGAAYPYLGGQPFHLGSMQSAGWADPAWLLSDLFLLSA